MLVSCPADVAPAELVQYLEGPVVAKGYRTSSRNRGTVLGQHFMIVV